MICPHCEKPIQWGKKAKLKTEAMELIRKGYSIRDVAEKLGNQVAAVTIWRWSKEGKK